MISARSVLLGMVSSLVLVIATIGAGGCGGGSASGVVASVGGGTVTRDAVNHWMQTLGAGEFYELSKGHEVPVGLASDPPNYQGCASVLERVTVTAVGRPKPDGAQLLNKCRELHQALRLQAAEFLVNTLWTEGVLRDLGLTATAGEVQQKLHRVTSEQFPKPGALSHYLAPRRRSLADELVLMKLDLLSEKATARIKTGGKPFVVRLTEAEQRWSSKTTCHQGYVVAHCTQYTPASRPASLASPAALMEQVAHMTGVPCISKQACP